jgi:hypothetical protein
MRWYWLSVNTNNIDSKPIQENTASKKPIQFMVDESFHREFKAYAATKGIKMSDLFKEMYGLYRESED